MNAESWQQIKDELDRLVELPPRARRVALNELEARNPELKSQVECYLEVEDDLDEFIEEPLFTLLSERGEGIGEESRTHPEGAARKAVPAPGLGSSPDASAPPPGRAGEDTITRVGPYRLKRLLGRGGMGQVHLAVREDDYEQQVAVKQTFGAVDSDKLMERFLRERQILANLQHPGIARLLDGGTDEMGFPYLVMEYVDGQPIDEYCDDQGLDVRQRLELFRQVCKAVHHAHQNLVVHRDLKPTNILVTEGGQPRLLDFGIAKLLEGQSFMQTAEGCAPLTPACASPEQLMGEPVTTACDVYALGILLYRLLSGCKPYDLEGLGYAGLVRKVCLSEPPPPSVAVARAFGETTSAGQDPDFTEISGVPVEEADTPGRPRIRSGRRLRRQLEGDLDAIVMKAMRKEPRHRYASAAVLSDDVKNFLLGLPVRARRGNWLYSTAKQLRRNRPAVAVLLLILASSVVSMALWRRAELGREAADEARIEAELARDEAEALYDFLTEMLSSADPDRSQGAMLTVREVVDAAVEKIDSFDGRPQTQSIMLATLSDVYDSLGLFDKGLELSEAALRYDRRQGPEMTLERIVLLVGLGRSHYSLSDYRSAERVFEQAYFARDQVDIPAKDLVVLYTNLAAVKSFVGKPEEAEQLYRSALEIHESMPGVTPEVLSSYHYGLGSSYLRQAEAEKAVAAFEKALELKIEAFGVKSTKTMDVQDSLAKAYLLLGDVEKAESLLAGAFETAESLLGPDHPKVGGIRKLKARAYLQRGALEEAEREAAAAVEILAGSSDGRWQLADARVVLAACRIERGQVVAAGEILRQSIPILEAQLREDHPAVQDARGLLEGLEAANP